MQQILRSLNVVRLFAFVLGYGLSGALVGGTLNRILVTEVGMPLSIVGLLFAVPLFITPLRAWLGHRSDAHPLRGLRREPYILLGALLAGIGVVVAILLIARATEVTGGLIVGTFLAFVIHEIGRNLSHNTFQALVAERFTGVQRARMITISEVITLLGLVVGAGGISRALVDYNPARLVSVTIAIATATFILSALAAIRSEARGTETAKQAASARRLTFVQALRTIALGDRQVRLFFVLIMFAIVGTLAQDVLLEPYGGTVLGMTVAQTTALTSLWGLGVMASMLVTGVLLIRFLSYLTILRIGLAATVIVFIGVILAGAMGSVGLFRALVVAMGLGSGLAGAGMLAGIMSFTTRMRAGLLMGIWGMAMVFGRSLGSLAGGVIADVLRSLTNGNDLVAYGAVFALEAVLLLVALGISARINIPASAAYVEVQQSAETGAVLGAASVA